MVALKRSKTGNWIARKVIPKDVRAEFKRLHGVSSEVILRLPAGTSKPDAKAQLGQWLAEAETQIERIRAAAKGEGPMYDSPSPRPSPASGRGRN